MNEKRPSLPADVKWYMDELARDRKRAEMAKRSGEEAEADMDRARNEENRRIAAEVAAMYAERESCTLRDVAPELAWTETDKLLYENYCRFQEAP